MDHQHHLPVLLREVINQLDPKPGERYLDATAGYGGHAEAVLTRVGKQAEAILVDQDQAAIDYLSSKFGNKKTVQILHDNYLRASQELNSQNQKFDMILADIGVSSLHLDKQERGFSLKHDGPLDMRMDIRRSLTAADIVNTYSEDDLVRVLRDYGEVRGAHRIARAIITNRPFYTTRELAEFIAGQNRTKKWSKIHPATTVFQALRIEVNDELSQLEHSLPLWFDMLAPGGRLAVISFHSLEDRIVKRYFAELTEGMYESNAVLLTKKVVTALDDELVYNPRARSAKLRAVAKIKTKKKGDAHNADSG